MVCDVMGSCVRNVGAERIWEEGRKEEVERNLLAQTEEDVGFWCCGVHV